MKQKDGEMIRNPGHYSSSSSFLHLLLSIGLSRNDAAPMSLSSGVAKNGLKFPRQNRLDGFFGGFGSVTSLLPPSLFFLATTGYLSNTSKEAKGGKEEEGVAKPRRNSGNIRQHKMASTKNTRK